jgi:hypothetical protein
MILSKQDSCAKRPDFATFDKSRNAAAQKYPCEPLRLCYSLRRILTPSQRTEAKMERSLFALSLGFVGLILATHTGWATPQSARLPAMTHQQP